MGKKFKPFLSNGLSWPTSIIKYLGVNIPLNKLTSSRCLKKTLQALFTTYSRL